MKGNLKRYLGYCLFLCIVSAALVFPVSSFAEDSVTIVSIDTNKVLQQYPKFQEAQSEYQVELQKMQQEMQEMGEEEQGMQQQMMQQRLQELGARLQEEATEALHKDVNKIARKKGYDYVIDSGVLISGGKDVTEEVMDALK